MKTIIVCAFLLWHPHPKRWAGDLWYKLSYGVFVKHVQPRQHVPAKYEDWGSRVKK